MSDLPTLPGCNPLQTGPESATIVTGCGAVTTTGLHATATSQPVITSLP